MRIITIVILSAAALWILYLVREPLGYIVLGAFVAVCAAGPVGTLSRYMKRGFAVLDRVRAHRAHAVRVGAILIIAIFDVIPLVGATIGAVIVGVFTAFADFPVDTIIWTIFAIATSSSRTTSCSRGSRAGPSTSTPFVLIVAALFGAALLGVIGAILAIPTAATIQVAIGEYRAYRIEMRALADGDPAGQVTTPAGPASSSAAP